MSFAGDSPDWLDAPSVGGYLLSTYSNGSVSANATVSAGIFGCAASPFLILDFEQASAVASQFVLQFYADSAGATAIGTALTWQSNNGGIRKRIVLATQGAYAKLSFENGNASNGCSMNIWAASQAITAAQSLGSGVTIFDIQAASVPKDSSLTFTPNIFLPGEAVLWHNGVASVYAAIMRWNGSGYDYVFQIPGIAAIGVNATVILPADDYICQILNNTSATVVVDAGTIAL